MRFGLERMRRLMTALDSPQERFAGGPGRGHERQVVDGAHDRRAPAARTALRTGAYMSPHIDSFAERDRDRRPPAVAARVSPPPCSGRRRRRELVDRGLDEGDRVTQFEALTAAAYWELGRAGVDVAVVEAGLGGRYDATSVIASRVLVLTNVGLEHTRWLGPTERHIAEEKLAVVPARRHAGGRAARRRMRWPWPMRSRRERDAALLLAGRDFGARGARRSRSRSRRRPRRYTGIELRALGGFQRANFALAVAAAESFLGGRSTRKRCARPQASCALPGRLELVAERPAGDDRRRPQPERDARTAARRCESLVGGRRLVAVHVDPGRQGRGRHAGAVAAVMRRGRVHAFEPSARALCPRRSRASAASSAARPARWSPSPRRRWSVHASLRARTARCW